MKLKQRKKELPLMNGIIRAWIKSQGRSLRKLSKQMGQGENYLQQNLKSNDIRPSLLIELSGWLGAYEPSSFRFKDFFRSAEKTINYSAWGFPHAVFCLRI